MKEYQARVVIERKELGEKINKLTAFISSEEILNVDESEAFLLLRQLETMTEYHKVLLMRLKEFQK